MKKELAKIAQKITDAFSGLLGGALLGSLGGLGIVAGAGVAISALVDRFTRRGKEKTSATGAAESLSSDFWGGTFEDVKAGRLSVDAGLAELNASWDAYVKLLHDTLKDQTVIQRSIDSQRATLTEGTAALENLRKTFDDAAKAEALKKATENLKTLGAQFIETGKMSDTFSKAVTDAGGSVSFFNRMAGEVERLQGLRQELGSLKQMIDSLIPPTKTWQQRFFETGEITEEMAKKIREAGGDIEQFKKFADMRTVKTQFESLVDEFGKTGVASDKLLELIKEFGGNDAMKAFEDLQAEARRSGKTIGELAKDSEASAKIIQDAFASTSTGINKAFGDAAKQLSDTLAKMDENLGKAIASLQAAMVTMISDLINVLLEVPGAAEKAARDANFFLGSIHDRDVRINFVASGLTEIENRSNQFGATGGITNPQPTIDPTTVTGGGSRDSRDTLTAGSRVPRFASGTDYVPRTGLAMVHQGEAIIPAGENRGGNVTVQVMGNVVANNPEQFMDELERYLSTNRDGARVRIQKALKLKQPGAF
jgi:hypothetical protein